MFAGTYFNIKIIVQTHPGNSCLESLGTSWLLLNATISRESLRDTTHWMNTINKLNALGTHVHYERDDSKWDYLSDFS